jgi:hypothetical protein
MHAGKVWKVLENNDVNLYSGEPKNSKINSVVIEDGIFPMTKSITCENSILRSRFKPMTPFAPDQIS